MQNNFHPRYQSTTKNQCILATNSQWRKETADSMKWTPTTVIWYHFWVWSKFAGPISMSWNRVSLRLNSVKNKYGVDIHNYVHYPQHILWLFDGWANLPSTTSVTNMIISSKLEYTSCFTSCPTTWDLRS